MESPSVRLSRKDLGPWDHIRQIGEGGMASNLLKSVCRSPLFMNSFSYIRSLLDFASPVRSTEFLRDKTTRVRSAALDQAVLNLSPQSYPERLRNPSLFSIKRRLLRNGILCYKTFHDLSVIKPNDFVMDPSPPPP